MPRQGQRPRDRLSSFRRWEPLSFLRRESDINMDSDPDQFQPAEVAALLRRIAPAQSHQLRRECLDVAKLLDGIEVPDVNNPVMIALPVRHKGEYVGWLQTVAHTYLNSKHEMDIHAETVFLVMSEQEREEYNGADGEEADDRSQEAPTTPAA